MDTGDIEDAGTDKESMNTERGNVISTARRNFDIFCGYKVYDLCLSPRLRLSCLSDKVSQVPPLIKLFAGIVGTPIFFSSHYQLFDTVIHFGGITIQAG